MVTELASRIGISLPLPTANENSVRDDTPIPVHTPGSDHSILFEAEGGTTLPTPRAESTPNGAGVAGEDSVPPMDADDSATAAPLSLALLAWFTLLMAMMALNLSSMTRSIDLPMKFYGQSAESWMSNRTWIQFVFGSH